MRYTFSDSRKPGADPLKPGSTLAAIALSLFSLVHLMRLVIGYDVVIAGQQLPSWISIGGFLVPLVIVWLLIKESK